MKKALIIIMAGIFLWAPLAAASLTLLSPNGGEKRIPGETKAITWKAENWTGYVNISIRKPDNCPHHVPSGGPIAHHVPAEFGEYMWQVGKLCDGTCLLLSEEDSQMTGVCNCYQITISVDGPSPVLSDKNDGNFYVCRFRFRPPLIRVPIAAKKI